MNYFRLLLNLYRLRRNIQKTPTQISRLQEQKLRKLLLFAYENSVYYKKNFEEHGITKDKLNTTPLSDFPTLNKEQLLTHFDELVTEPDLRHEALRQFDEENSEMDTIYLNKYHLVRSSGSTGIPRYFVYDIPAWEQMLLGILRGGLWDVSVAKFFKWYFSNPKVLYIAATDGRYGGVLAVGDGISGLGVKQQFLDINTPLSQWISSVMDFQPKYIIGYPSAIKILGELMETDKVQLQLNRIISCGEPLSPGLRSYLENTFNTEVVNFYGASESLALGVEPAISDSMVLFDDLNIIEIIDGEMYLTCLYNFVQPLIRYHISDRLVLHQKDASDTHPFSKADVLLSRHEDVLWFDKENGEKEFLHPLSVEGFCIEGLLDYQFVQTSTNAFEMLAELSNGALSNKIKEEIQLQMQNILAENGLDEIEFSVRFVEQIMPDPSTGKKRLTIKMEDR